MTLFSDYLHGLPDFLAYFSASVSLILLFSWFYTRLTPHDEWQLIKQNNQAAAIAFGGSLIGFTLPLHSAILNSVNWVDCLLWASVALILQMLTFLLVRRFIPNISERIEQNENASAIFIASASICVGLLNAASMSY